MKKNSTFRTLLVGLLALGATSAWGDATTIYERGTTNEWSDTDLTDWVLSGTAESSIDAKGLKFAKTAAARTEYTYTKSFTTSENAIVTMDLDWIVENANGSATAGCYFVFGDVKLFWCGQNRDLKLTIGENETALISGGNTNLRGTTFHVNLSVDKASKNVSYSISNASYNSGTAIEGNGTISTSDLTSVAFGWSRGGQQNVSSQIISKISISEEAQSVSTANYTINYKNGETVVKTVSSSGVVGNSISAQMAIEGEGDYAENHYLITSEDVPSMVLTADDNVLNVPVRLPYTATLNVTTTIGDTEPTVKTTNLVETDDKVCAWSYAYPLYVKYGDKFYQADNTDAFGESGTFTNGEVINKSVSYSNSDESVVFFAEAESNPGSNFTYSNGGRGFVGAQNARDRGISVGTLPAGEYELLANITAANRRSLGIRQSTNDFLASVATSNDDMATGLKSASFTLNEETSNLFINGANSGEVKTNQSEDFDYVLIKKVIPTAVTVTITAAGYATYCSEYALDFSNVEGLTAYTASLSGAEVSFPPVTGAIPANTGVLLKGAEGTYQIPVASSASDVTSALEGVTEATDKEAGIFVLMNGSEGVGFYKTTAASFTVGAHTAYIPALPNTSRSFIAIDEATAIKTIEKTEQSDEIYNLAGQRVKSAQKGLYIIGGKKVVIK